MLGTGDPSENMDHKPKPIRELSLKYEKLSTLINRVDLVHLWQAHDEQSQRKAPGVDKITKDLYTEHLMSNLENLVDRMKRILLLEGFFDESDLPLLEKFDIETIVHNRHMIEILKAHAPFKSLKVHIKINSGMNRLGFLATEEEGVRAELEAIEGVRVMGVVTHFANAEPTYEADKPATVSLQLSRMRQIEPRPEHLCMANSAATLWQDDVKGDAVRAGVALYGASPDSHYTSEDLDIRPAMTLSAKILAIQNVPAGEAIGYGSRFVTHRDSRIAVVACGYADGYPRSTPDGTPTYVEGKIAPIAGAISMDMLTIDVTDVPEARLGSEVELWGSHIPVNEVAKRCGTIGYELLCAIALRVPIVEDEQ